MMAVAGAILIVTVLAKLFPIMPIWEVAHDEGITNEEMNKYVKEEA